jgi:hypothetical protein
MTKRQSNRPERQLPKGRTTIRKHGSLSGLHGPSSRPIKLWVFEPNNATLAKLEQAYQCSQ